MKRLGYLFLPFFLAGCATVKISEVGGQTVADINNTGWYLFNLIPLASGNPSKPNSCGCRLFTETVTLENNLRMLDYAMRTHIDEPAKLSDTRYGEIVSYTTDESILFILLKRHVCHTTAELIVNPEAK